jgi:hypothetical protein
MIINRGRESQIAHYQPRVRRPGRNLKEIKTNEALECRASNTNRVGLLYSEASSGRESYMRLSPFWAWTAASRLACDTENLHYAGNTEVKVIEL